MPSADSAQPQSSSPRHLRVFLASPGDVAEERKLAMRVLKELQYDSLLYSWEDDKILYCANRMLENC